MSQSGIRLTYQPYSSIINPGFWQQLMNVKLNDLRLSEDPIEIRGTYSFGLSNNLPCLASFDHGSFNVEEETENRTTCVLNGHLICFNIPQDMIDFNKNEFSKAIGSNIWSAIQNGSALKDPEKHLSKFGLLVFADLKKYKFTYWFVFPALNYPNDVYQTNCDSHKLVQQPITKFFNDQELDFFQEQYDRPSSNRPFQRGYFVVIHNEEVNQISCISLEQYKLEADTYSKSRVYFAYADPCPSDQYPGWPLRNFLALIAVQFNLNLISVIRVRRGQPTLEHKSYYHHSSVLDISYELDEVSGRKTATPVVTGWERNELQQLAPKRVDLSGLLDPTKLATDAVNLNLKLMKWRLLPSLNLEKIAQTRCLLLGCGTLGCHIARGLLAWGIKHISLVDNSKISYSNPVRQTLYTFEDCLNKDSGSLFKAVAAAKSLRKIHPTVDVESHVMSIPMPGHHVGHSEIESTKKVVEKLEDLIDKHDVIFLLMDTRESRWLPTVISMSKQKLVINAAIGFDTFLLQRFGIREYSKVLIPQFEEKAFTSCPSDSNLNELESDKLGCYFCNDIVAPGDSTMDRTLDQQCTVSRPGVSMMVSAMAVEFLASIISSPLGPKTPAPLQISSDQSMINDEDLGSELGIVPHSLRGNMSRYHVYMPTSPCFNKCSACSSAVISAYLKRRFEFLLQVFNDPNYLEEIAGLKDLQNVSDDVWALDSDEMPADD